MHAYKMCNCIVTSSVNRKDLSVRSKTCAEAPDHFLKGQKRREIAERNLSRLLSPKCSVLMRVRVQLLCPWKWKRLLRNSCLCSSKSFPHFWEMEASWSAETCTDRQHKWATKHLIAVHIYGGIEFLISDTVCDHNLNSSPLLDLHTTYIIGHVALLKFRTLSNVHI